MPLTNDASVALKRWAESDFWMIDLEAGDHLFYRFVGELIACPEIDWDGLFGAMYNAAKMAHFKRFAILESEYCIREVIEARIILAVQLVGFSRTCGFATTTNVA